MLSMRLLYSIFLALISVWSLQGQDEKSGYLILESHLPIVSIRTYNQTIPDEPKIEAKMAIIQNDKGETNTLQALFSSYPMHIGIEMRGESSQYFYPKKSYGIETRDSLGENLNISVLGLLEENDWILYGPYGDKTMIRNALVYELAGKIMEWSPTLVYCELVINNNYQGVYLFGEKIKRDKNRVDIAKLLEKDSVGNDLTGGYIIKIDKGERDYINGWYSNYLPTPTSTQRIFYQYHYPKPEDITLKQRNYIKSYMNVVERSLYDDDFLDPDKGYKPNFDVESFIDYFLLNEISRNVDGYRLSTFLYKDKDSTDGRLKIGPVWDYNLGFGNANYCNGFDHAGWAYKHNETCPNDYWSVPFWWDRFMEDPAFKNRLKTRWVELREGIFHKDSIIQIIDTKAETMGSAVTRNFSTWPILGRWVWPNYEVGNTYDEELDELKRWISYRLTWMDYNMPGIQISTGTEEFANELIVEAYPNPFDEYFIINGPIQPKEELDFRVFSTTGSLVQEQKIRSFPTRISLNHQNSGFYYFSIHNKEGLILYRSKMIKN